MKYFFIFSLLSALSAPLFSQTGVIRGKVFNQISQEPIPFANVVIQGTATGATTDDAGQYEITGLQPGQYNLVASFVGFEELVVFEVQVTNARPAFVDFPMKETSAQLEEVVVTGANSFFKPDESPLSLRTIGTTEIKRMPGGNRDISKVVRALPGVASTPSFRNDIIIRGGAPSENTFYLDGIQIPVINHFQTQGSSGGPVGMINVDLLQEVDFYSGAFPANRGNTMSSVFDFKLKEGRQDHWTFNGVVGATDLGVTLDGPINSKSSLVFSARRSYLKFLFNIFNLPFLPVYNDAQFKYSYRLNEKNRLTLIGIGAIDDFELNFDAPGKAENEAEREEAEYILNILPVSTQWNYTVGLRYDHFRQNGTTSVILSHNTLNNESVKYQGNDMSSSDNLIQQYQSRENEIRFRVEDYQTRGDVKINFGAGVEYGTYDTQDFTKLVTQQGLTLRNFDSWLAVAKYNFFGQVSNTYFNKLTLSFGVRADATNYSRAMSNPLEQVSPRLSASYKLSERISFNFNSGIYYQLPSYSVLGYRNTETGELENQKNGVQYIKSTHLVSGIEFNFRSNARFTTEGFYKWYDHYPFLLEDSISLANLGADFGIVGNAPVNSTSRGRSYGIELMLQQKLFEGFYGIASYTFVRSEFENGDDHFTPSSWDNRHLVSITGGKRFQKNWELGVRWLFTGGSPFTPYDIQKTVRRENWDVRPYGIPDYAKLNHSRISAFHQLDLRVDKKYYFKKWSLNIYVDVQNAYNHVTTFQDNIDVEKDDTGVPVIDPDDSDYYIPKFIQNTSGTILPTIGIIVEL